jgi:transposase
MKRYVVTLRGKEREQLTALANKGKSSARRRRIAQVLLKADRRCGWKDERIAEAFGVCVRTVERIRERFVEDGLEITLDPPRKPRVPQKIDGDVEARLVTLACSAPPDGRQRWTLRLLADKLVELEVVESISHEAVRLTLKKTS